MSSPATSGAHGQAAPLCRQGWCCACPQRVHGHALALVLRPAPRASLPRSWVRSVAFDPSNEWFVTGSADRTIKIWDTASGQLKLTLTGHIEQVTGLAVSARHPYMFSCGLDKMVKCWDLEQNKVGP